MNTYIRACKETDYSAIENIYNDSKLDELQFESETFQLLPLKQDTRRHAALMESDIYVYDDQEIKGFIALHEREIRALFVAKEARGNGIGEGLLNFALRKLKAGKVSLYIASSNKLARALYEKHGFQSVEQFQTEYNGQPVMADQMILNLKEG